MMERYFVVHKAKDAEEVCFSIPETELRRRLQMILNEYGAEVTMAGVNWEWSCDILLHGEPQEQDEIKAWVDTFPLKGWQKGMANELAHWILKMPRGK